MGELYGCARKAFLKAGVAFLFLLIAWYVVSGVVKIGYLPLLVGFGIIAVYALYHYLQARHRVIFLHENHLQYRHGILNIQTINVPYNKIDNVRTMQSLPDRLLGLIQVEIDTPGEKIVEIVFPDADAKAFKVFYEKLHKKLEEVKGSGNL